jgi:hypothetical protein
MHFESFKYDANDGFLTLSARLYQSRLYQENPETDSHGEEYTTATG